jgi:hypothetical protein
MGYTEAKYGRTFRVFHHEVLTTMTAASDAGAKERIYVFPGPIKLTKIGFLSTKDNATMATGCTVSFYRDKKVTAKIIATDLIGEAASYTTGVTTASKAVTTTNTIAAGTALIIAKAGVNNSAMKGIIFFDYVIPFAEEETNDGWDGVS